MYQDSNGLWHDKPNRISNNVYIYGLYAKLLGLDVSSYPEYFRRCVVIAKDNYIKIYRHPKKAHPPLSFDECIGMVGLGLLDYSLLKSNHFVYLGKGEKLDSSLIEKLIKAIVESTVAFNINLFMSGKKKVKLRNLWWRKNLQNVKYFATRLNPAHVYVIKRFNGVKPHEEERLMWKFYSDNLRKAKVKSHSDLSQRNMLWALYLMSGDARKAKKLKPWKSFEGYFGSGHPFTKAIKKKYGVR